MDRPHDPVHPLGHRADPREPPLLIVAASARSLGASAKRGGRIAVLLDYFADEDTRSLGMPAERIDAEGELRPDRRRLLAAATALASRCSGVVYGSCFDDRRDLLAELVRERPLLGNPPEVLAAAKDPQRFFPLLASLGIPHPETRTARPAHRTGWLAKRVGGTGGAHVTPIARCDNNAEDIYYQRLEDGSSRSVLFLADGRRVRIVGFCEQLQTGDKSPSPFAFAGLIGPAPVSDAVVHELGQRLEALTRSLGLVGLNGLDFLERGDAYSVLELNPRPTAALEVFDADWPDGLLDLHIRACRGELPDDRPVQACVRGYLIAYASVRSRLGAPLPHWCADRPPPGAVFGAGQPICTIHAAGGDCLEVRRLLARRRARVESLLVAEKAA